VILLIAISVPIAIKFNPMVKLSKFRGYGKPKIGINGVVTPMLHFDEVDFLGGIHDHASGHSFSRINSMGLRLEDWLKIEYVNEVMPYAVKADDPRNELNTNPVEPFPERCPYCGNIFKLSKSSKNLIDDNINCIARRLAKTVNMIAKLNIKDFAEASVEKLKPMSFSQMINVTEEDVAILGEANSAKFLARMKELRENRIEDYKILGALGFTNVAIGTWQKILSIYKIYEIIYLYRFATPEKNLRDALVLIKGIGKATADTIVDEMPMFIEDIEYIEHNMTNVISTRGTTGRPKIVFTGFRDNELVKILEDKGYDATKSNVTKDTYLLIVSDSEYKSGNLTNAKKYGIPIVTLAEFESNMEEYL
jgi:NAD-dependent DNA ligase